MSTAVSTNAETLNIAGRSFLSRLIVGTGKYRSFEEMKAAHRASGAEMVTVAVRRDDWPRRTLSDGDRVEIVHFVGGG